MAQSTKMTTPEERQFWIGFLELYKSKPELWKIKSDDYNNRAKKSAAYNVLAEMCKEVEPNADRDYVKKKINCFRSSYRRALKRLNKRQQSGADPNDEYVQTSWCYKYLDFLKDQEEAVGSDYGMGDSENEDNKFTKQKEDEPRSKKRKACSSTDELVRLATERLKAPQNSSHQISIVWANKLSKMNRDQRIIAEKVINEVMFNGELGLLNFNTTLTNINTIRKLNPSSSFDKNNPVINSSDSQPRATATNNYRIEQASSQAATDAIQQKFSIDHINYSSSPLLTEPEIITDDRNEQTTENFIVAEYDILDNSIKIEE